MKNIINIYLLIFFLPSITYGQFIFNRAYDNNSTNDYGEAVIQTLDGGYFFSGSTDYSDSIVFFPMFLIKTNNKGNIEWTRKYSFSKVGITSTSSVIQLKDSSYVISGTTQDTNEYRPDAFLFRITKDGDSVWLHKYDNGWNDYGDDVKQTSDGGFILIATSWDSSSSGFNTNAWLIKTDSTGNIEWDSVYGGSEDDVPEKIIIDDDGGFIFCGSTKSYGDGINNDTWIFKTNSNGDSLWQSVIRTDGNPDGVWDIKKTKDGGFVFAGGQYVGGVQWGYVLKTNNLGIKQWDKTYGGVEGYLYKITQLVDSTYVVAGGLHVGGSSNPTRGWLLKVSTNGNTVLWSKNYTHYNGNGGDYIYDMKPTTDGGYIMAGMVTGGGVLKQDIWFLKTDCMGNDTFWDSVNCPLKVGIKKNPLCNEPEKCGMIIYPNPFSNSATLQIMNPELFQSQNLTFEMYDVLGRKAEQFVIISPLSEIKRNNLPDGIYFYRIKNKNEITVTGKLIISE